MVKFFEAQEELHEHRFLLFFVENSTENTGPSFMQFHPFCLWIDFNEIRIKWTLVENIAIHQYLLQYNLWYCNISQYKISRQYPALTLLTISVWQHTESHSQWQAAFAFMLGMYLIVEWSETWLILLFEIWMLWVKWYPPPFKKKRTVLYEIDVNFDLNYLILIFDLEKKSTIVLKSASSLFNILN